MLGWFIYKNSFRIRFPSSMYKFMLLLVKYQGRLNIWISSCSLDWKKVQTGWLFRPKYLYIFMYNIYKYAFVMYKRRNKVFLVQKCDYRAHVDVTTLRRSWVLCWFFSPGSSALGARWSGWHTFWDRHRRTPCLNRLPSSWTGTVFPGSPSGKPPRKLVLGSRLSPLPYPIKTDIKKKILGIFRRVALWPYQMGDILSLFHQVHLPKQLNSPDFHEDRFFLLSNFFELKPTIVHSFRTRQIKPIWKKH